MTTIDYPDIDTLPAAVREALTTHTANVYRMIGHSHGMAESFLSMADAMLQANSVPFPLRELAILRVGYVYDAAYEVHHHERIARAVGLSDDAMTAAATGTGDGLSAVEAAVLRWTDQLLDGHTLDTATRHEALETFSVTELADFVLTVGFYQLVCNFLNAFGVTTDGED
ncbi:carboxymuconolactone decarboxylase family protein [Gordonia hydrophobica]|uniref:Carboxymuconolactone decarboxylase family protein n=1 Tax=Gordonia hydrophobica TaxID=40516 RepID=A0ABZ2U4G8_9ACTN|nr:carboxymuconolactone decarboxylase family protein [Gordonia hydrophobica]MBM7368102.1 alkylhydroperoxidase family enzyme [Gordonia hydrophobica]